MCFSASASFGAGTLLSVIGVAAIRKTHHPSQLMFAGITFIFGMQQLSEGMLWLTLPNPDYVNLHRIFTAIFLFFAQILWPVWVPVAILLLEKKSTRKTIQKVFAGAGLLTGGYLGYCLLTYPVEARIEGHHISYFLDYPAPLSDLSMILYGLATVVPPFFSHIKRMWMIGVIFILAYVAADFFFEQYVLSVWCFFAAIISAFIYAIMVEISNTEKQRLQSVVVTR
ncbi:MAG: hypothetical protein J0L62_16465 [Bacteroidetes bacterium]|nr:hypothetical protein [Bacteroidota bacterium]